MTALNEYQRLEASGLWRASAGAQRAEVIVSVGDATLTISDMRDRALAHWSLPAIERANPGVYPAIYFPDGDPEETLELFESEGQMIEAIEKLRAAISRRRPHPGRLRLVMLLVSLATVVALAVFWLPGAARQHAVAVVPEVKRDEIGHALLGHLQKVTGPACRDVAGNAALQRLSQRLASGQDAPRLIVFREGVRRAAHLPGRFILLNRALVEDYEEPDVVAGFVVVEQLRAATHDPLDRVLAHGGLWASIHLLTTGTIRDETLRAYAEHLLTRPAASLADEALLGQFETARLRSTPYAYAIDISGETTLALIEADPFAAPAPEAVLSDADWLRLQGICGG